MIKLEERKDDDSINETRLLFEHRKAIFSFLWLFIGFVIELAAFIMEIILLFNAAKKYEK
jgi:hypothetical protein